MPSVSHATKKTSSPPPIKPKRRVGRPVGTVKSKKENAQRRMARKEAQVLNTVLAGVYDEPLTKREIYRQPYAKLARTVCRIYGSTDDELGRYFAVNVSTIRRWKDENPEFREACYDSKLEADVEIMQSLHKRAKGYTVKTEKLFFDAREGEIIRGETALHIPPDTKAAEYWLNNRQPELFRSKVDVHNSSAPQIIQHVFTALEKTDATTPEAALEAYNALLELAPSDYKDVTSEDEE